MCFIHIKSSKVQRNLQDLTYLLLVSSFLYIIWYYSMVYTSCRWITGATMNHSHCPISHYNNQSKALPNLQSYDHHQSWSNYHGTKDTLYVYMQSIHPNNVYEKSGCTSTLSSHHRLLFSLSRRHTLPHQKKLHCRHHGGSGPPAS